MDFVDRLTKILQEKNISGYKMCKDIGLPLSSINNWKKGSLPTIDKFKTIIEYLDISPYYLLGIEESEIQNDNAISNKEKRLIQAYRKAEPAIQQATRKILDIEEEPEKSLTSRTG